MYEWSIFDYSQTRDTLTVWVATDTETLEVGDGKMRKVVRCIRVSWW
jgi:hypothetical protein